MLPPVRFIGSAVAAAAHAQMTGEWPALIVGASASSVIRGILSRVEVTERKTATAGVAALDPAGEGGGDGSR